FSVMAVLVKAIPRIPAQEKVFVRSALNVAFTLALMWRYEVPVLGRNVRVLALRGALGYLALSCHFWSLGALPLALALVLHNTSPRIVALAGGLMSALAYVTVRGIGKSEHPLTVVLYFPLVSAAASIVPAARAY